jgi:hypothetical protein
MRDHGWVRYPLLAFLVVSHAAFAQPTAGAQATVLFDQGRDLVKQGNYAAACDRFAQSFMLDPAPGTELNLGDCHERLGHYAQAWRHFDDAATKFTIVHDDRAGFARKRRDALSAKVGIVVVKLANPSSTVSIAGRSVPGARELQERVDPGTVEIRVDGASRNTDVAAGATTVVDFSVASESIAPQPVTPVETPEPASPTSRRWQKLAAYVAGGTGVVAGGIALGLGLDARSRYNSTAGSSHCTRTGGTLACDDTGVSELDSAIRMANAGTGIGIASIVLLAGGAVLYFTAPRDSVVVTPTATSTSAGVSVSGSF